jgi:hypothetical protein
MTTELQNQMNASSIKIENWQEKKRIQEAKYHNLTNINLNFEKSKVEGIIENIHSKIGKTRDGLYKFIEAL